MVIDQFHKAGLQVFPKSLTEINGEAYALVSGPGREKQLVVAADPAGFDLEQTAWEGAWLCKLNHNNALELRKRLPWLNPVTLGLQTSMGFGDRLGLATPGHVRALEGMGVLPVFAQQSVRENTRTGRTPQQVLDEAMWGVFQGGYRGPWGADGDHLKTEDELALFVSAGYTAFTVDSGLHVDDAAQTDAVVILREKVAGLPWAILDSSPEKLRQEFLNRPIDLEDFRLAFDEATLLRAAAKYGRVVAHVTRMYHCLAEKMGAVPFDFEVSIDETQTPTSAYEHAYIAQELRRLGVQWTSLAPRFIGEFAKGVDYQGDLQVFETDFSRHCALMNYYGEYKLSLHSGSDKFSIYPAIAKHTQGLIHVKTAGTSYLEALRVLAVCSPELFRPVLALARARFPEDRFSYMVTASLESVPEPETLGDAELAGLLDQFDARQVLHVTFGSVLGKYGEPLKNALLANEEDYYEQLQAHFTQHLMPFAKK
jgi:tagaturonate epimerase